MPREARRKSQSNIYHVMLRGINRQNIFEDDQDRKVFLNIMKACKEVSGFNLYAFCLMSNHVHFLIEPGQEPLELVFKRIGVRYVGWYNKKYDRVGHLFQDRFKSENVETNGYFLTVLRYIIQNPMKAGMEKNPGFYRWSSYFAYRKGEGSITDTEYALSFFESRDQLLQYLWQENDDAVMEESGSSSHISEDFAKDRMIQITKCDSVPAFQALEKLVQRQYIKELHMAHLSSRQISRLTGVPRSTVLRTVKAIAPQPIMSETLFLEKADIEYDDIQDEIW